MIARKVVGAALLAAALTAARGDPLAGRTAGPPSNCLDLDLVGGPDIVDAHTILYRQSARRVWRTEPIGACPGMRYGDTLIVELYGRQMCRNDRFRAVHPGSLPGAVCRFGPFVPYDRAR